MSNPVQKKMEEARKAGVASMEPDQEDTAPWPEWSIEWMAKQLECISDELAKRADAVDEDDTLDVVGDRFALAAKKCTNARDLMVSAEFMRRQLVCKPKTQQATMQQPTLQTVLDLSTAHMPTVNEGTELTNDFGDLRWAEHEHGFIVFVDSGAAEGSVPMWLKKIHDYAVGSSCLLINFDSDADAWELFEEYDG